jgi:hypothetical protein
MPPPRVRYDAYGKPIPALVDARQESLYDAPVNQERRHLLHTMLDEELLRVLRRDVNADVTLHCAVTAGVIQIKLSVGALRHDRAPHHEVE